MAHLPASPAAAAGYRVSPSPRSSPSLPQRKAVPSSCRAAGSSSWSWRAATSSNRTEAGTIVNPNDVPILSFSEVAERLDTFQASDARNQNYMAMYSSIFGGITTDPSAMVIPIDDHMVHRGHGVFDTAAIMDGHLYELEQHLDRFLRSALMAKIALPFDRSTIRSILIQTVSASKCTQGSLRYWLSVGPGDFQLSSSGCANSALYAIVIESPSLQVPAGCKVVTSSIPIKSPQFAVMKSVNYLPNVLMKVEGEENGAFTGIWLDDEGFVAEGSNMNVGFVTKSKELLMPRFDKILSGCTVKRVMTLAEQLVADGRLSGIISRNVSVQEGKVANEMMLIGSGIIVKSVVQWDDQIIGSGKEGPIARALYDLILEDMRSGPPSVRIPVPY
ncbi:D-amino-acid transaminase, chloroplastic isoform X2 [Phragmites australis]|uniref:D-amino-acid transaminase, chloroplastic isoform X2 n=1 Tax=Phragmites australis TaxID=29695 RepID=UPI002D7A3FF5|nr:D-amino-acid transaminase, chloroplastic isoform X2 [Phragmites australis]